MRIAYADPPYIGQAKRHYGPKAEEVNHALLAEHLREYDGWALSLSSPSLYDILPLFPERPRIAAWVKPFASFKPGVNPAYCWEPVLFSPARKNNKDIPTVRDYVSANITLMRGTHGAKPATFCSWLFQLLGAEPTDYFTDMFPGSGAVMREWEHFAIQSAMIP